MEVEQPVDKLIQIPCLTSDTDNTPAVLEISESVLNLCDGIRNFPEQNDTPIQFFNNLASQQKPTKAYITKLFAPIIVWQEKKLLPEVITTMDGWTDGDLMNVFIDYFRYEIRSNAHQEKYSVKKDLFVPICRL